MPPRNKPSTDVPQNWPSSLPYLAQSARPPALTSTQLSALQTAPHSNPLGASSIFILSAAHPRGPSPLVRIQPIDDRAHPACGQSGLFAAQDLAPDSFIVQYVGELHVSTAGQADDDGAGGAASADADPHAASDYDLSLDRDTGLAIDAARMGNEARFVNDYRGVPAAGGGDSAGKESRRGNRREQAPRKRSSLKADMSVGGAPSSTFTGDGFFASSQAPPHKNRPNAEFREIWDAARSERGIGVFVLPESRKDKAAVSKKKSLGIKKGEEILVSYGRGFWAARRDDE